MIRKKTKEILSRYDIRLSKKHGQSHLVNEEVLRRIVDYGEISSAEKILEIGPGIGNLTELLLEKAEEVIAVEKDKRLIPILNERFKENSNLNLVQGDILEIELPNFHKVIANLPYSISSPVTSKILKQKFDFGILMYQKEFAERMVAEPGSRNYNSLTVNLLFQAEAEILEEVPPNAFMPQPEVWSAIVKVTPREPPFEVLNKNRFYKVVKSAFQHRRKKIRNSLRNSFERIFPNSNFSKEEKREIIDKALPEEIKNLRPGQIKPKDFGKISNSLEEISAELPKRKI